MILKVLLRYRKIKGDYKELEMPFPSIYIDLSIQFLSKHLEAG